MSEPKKPEPGSEAQPQLTPAEQQQQDETRVHGQLVVTDAGRVMENVMEAFGGSGLSGRTSFEGHELNAMIDLIEQSKPEQLEEAGKALWEARDAIREAAEELGTFIEGVDWRGESGTAFRDWGNGLVAHANKLGDFADVAGTQITVAGTGLASVRSSLPPRDSRLVRKTPDEVETPKRVEGNAEYEAAVKVEKDRQEAINQANRLASYYAVSQETLAAQEPPRFEKKLDVAMPRPRSHRDGTDEPGSSSSWESASVSGGGSVRGSEQTITGSQDSSAGGHGYKTPEAVAPVQDRSTSTEINSIATLPSHATTPVTPTPAPSTSPASPAGGSTPPVANGFVNPVTSSSRATQAGTSAPRAVGQARMSGPSGGGPAANGRTGAPVGRPAPMTGGSTSGSSGRAGGGPQAPTAGRSGVTGGRPTAVGQAGTSGATGSRARQSGIVGGTPQRAVPGASAPGGPRGVARGNVIGVGGTGRTGGSGAIGQRGVFGSGGTSSASRPSGRGTSNSSGIVGTPRSGAARSGAGAKGFTPGGAGLVRGPAGRQAFGDEEQDEGTPRPDYLTEDRETWEAGRRRAVPPVTE